MLANAGLDSSIRSSKLSFSGFPNFGFHEDPNGRLQFLKLSSIHEVATITFHVWSPHSRLFYV